jgi:hypothetical protein
MSQPRVRTLPNRGTLLVSTDLHGNGEDFRTLRALFLDTLAGDPHAHWVLLGDLVHGPNPEARARHPELYDFEDESWPIVAGVIDLLGRHPGQVHLVLGNHDHAHLGGPRTRKFYRDEAAHLEARLSPDQVAALRELFRSALLAVIAPCGLLLTHGSPGAELRSLDELDRITFPLAPGDHEAHALVSSFLESYGQRAEVTAHLLETVSRAGPRVWLVVHGHDRDESGYFTEGGNQVCPVLFGALRPHKRYLRLDLSASYTRVEDLREGEEVRRLYPS